MEFRFKDPLKQPFQSRNLNEIPVGTIFSGTVFGISNTPYKGVFYKAYGAWSGADAARGECVVVQLSTRTATRANLFVRCTDVHDYKEIKGKFVEDGS